MQVGRRRFFLVERYIPSISSTSVASAARRLVGPVDAPTRHLVTLLVADEATCLSVFEATDPGAVAVANADAGFPLDRIVELDLVIAPGLPDADLDPA